MRSFREPTRAAGTTESIARQLAITVPGDHIESIARACGITIEDVLDHLPAFISSYITDELLYELRTDRWTQAQFTSFVCDEKEKRAGIRGH